MKVLRGISKMGKARGLYLTSIKISNNVYATGQTIVPGKKDTSDFLTFKEATGVDPMSREKMEKFPFVINPFETYVLPDGYKFNDDDPRDQALLGLIKLFPIVVSQSKKDVNRKYHEFYIEDVEAESEILLTNFNKVLEAGNKVMEMTTSEKQSFARFLRIHKKDLSLTEELSSTRLIQKLTEYAQSNPDLIIKFTKPENKVWLKVTELIARDIITTRDGNYYDGNHYLTSSLEKLIRMYNDDPEKKTRWDKKLLEIVGDSIKAKKEPVLGPSKSQKLVSGLKEALMTVDFIEALKIVAKLEAMTDDEFAIKSLEKYSKAILKIKNSLKSGDVIDVKKINTVKDLHDVVLKIGWEDLQSKYKEITGEKVGKSSREGYREALVELMTPKEI